MSQIKQSKVILATNNGLHIKIPYIIHQGGTYSGKTFGIVKSLIEYAYINDNKTIDIVGQSVPHLNTGAKKDFDTILDLENLQIAEKKIEKLYTFPTGTAIRFLTVDKLGKAKGGKRDILFINECNEISYLIAKQLMLRTNDTVILDYNPTSVFWWQQKLLPSLNKDQYFFYRTTYKDNPSISEKKSKEIESLKKEDQELYNIYAKGITGKLTGVIFKYNIVDEMPNVIGNGLDFGFSADPTAFINVGYENGQLYFDEIIYETGLINNEIAKKINNKHITIADSAEPKSIEELNRLGIYIKGAVKGKDSVNFGIQLMKKFKINITKRSVNLIKEFNNYKWQIDKNGDPTNKPIDKFNHGIDGVRYFVTYKFGKKEQSLKSVIMKSNVVVR